MKRLEYLGITGMTLLIVWILQGLLSLQPGTAASRIDNSELRGVWLTNVDSQVFFSNQGIEEAVAQLADHNFNTLYPAVWSWGYTLYPSPVSEQVTGYRQGLYPDLEDQGRNEALEASQSQRDVLQETIQAAHSRQIEVIPWFEFGFMAPATAPLAQRHPEWLTQKRGTLPQSRLYQEGRHTRVWLNPFHPEVQAFILTLVDELMERYEVDGFQIDDHFGLPVEFGYDPYTVALYQQEHGGKSPPSNPRNSEWMRWRARKITEFLDQVFRVVKARRADAVFSVSPNPADFAYRHYLQEWPRWRQMGYIEELIVQVYRNNLGTFRAILADPTVQRARTHIPTAVGILTGLKNQPVSTSLIRQQVQATRAMDLAGVSFFFYDTVWDGGEIRRTTVQDLFDRPRPRPSIATWR